MTHIAHMLQAWQSKQLEVGQSQIQKSETDVCSFLLLCFKATILLNTEVCVLREMQVWGFWKKYSGQWFLELTGLRSFLAWHKQTRMYDCWIPTSVSVLSPQCATHSVSTPLSVVLLPGTVLPSFAFSGKLYVRDYLHGKESPAAGGKKKEIKYF